MAVVERLFIDSGSNRLEARLCIPTDLVQGSFVLCHPNPPLGGNMFNKVIVKLADLFVKDGYSVLRYNMAGVGRSTGALSDPMGARRDLEAVCRWFDASHPTDDLWMAGYSYGAFLALSSQVHGLPGAFAGRFPLKGIVAVAYPSTLPDYRLDRLPDLPMAFIHAWEDELIPAPAAAQYLEEKGSVKKIAWVEGANHSFDGKLAALQATCSEALASLK